MGIAFIANNLLPPYFKVLKILMEELEELEELKEKAQIGLEAGSKCQSINSHGRNLGF